MGAISAALKHMLAAGMDYDAIVKAVAEMEASEAPVKTARQLRNARYYHGKSSEKRLNSSNQDVSDDSVLVPSRTRVEDKTSNSQIEVKKENKSAQSARVSDLDEFRSALSASVDSERIESYVKHRRTKRGQITGHAARLFLGDAEACSLSPSEAIDACISRNWITVKPEYFAGRNARASPSSAPSMADVFELVGKRQGDERKSEDFSGTGAVVPYLPAFGQRRQ